jgi:hypothetical protein
MTIMDVNECNRLVQQARLDYQASLQSGKVAQKEYSEEGHDRVHRRVARLYKVASKLMADKSVLGSLLGQNGIVPRAGTNPYWYIVKLVCRKDKKGGGTVFDPSAGKWANSLRYFAENDWGEDEEAIFNRLKTFKLVVAGRSLGGLKATEAADRAAHNDTDEVQAFEDAAFEDLAEQGSDLSLPGDAIKVEGATEGMFASVVFQLRGGEWLLRGVSDANGESSKRSISKRVVAGFKLRHDELLYKLAQANDETAKLNAMPAAMQRIFTAREERRLAEEAPLDPALWQEPASVEGGANDDEDQLADEAPTKAEAA